MFCFSLAMPSRDLDGSCSFNEAETQNLLASRQQNQAVCVGKGKRGRGALSMAALSVGGQTFLEPCQFYEHGMMMST